MAKGIGFCRNIWIPLRCRALLVSVGSNYIYTDQEDFGFCRNVPITHWSRALLVSVGSYQVRNGQGDWFPA